MMQSAEDGSQKMEAKNRKRKDVNPRGRLMAAEDQKWNTKRRNRDEVARKKIRVTNEELNV